MKAFNEKIHRILPALPLAAALAFAPAAFAQSGHAVPTAPFDSSAVPMDTAAVDTPKGDLKGDAKVNTRKGDAKKEVKASGTTTRKTTTSKKTVAPKDPHAGHNDHDHSAAPKDTTVILGTPGSPTTRGVPGTEIKGEK